MKANIFFFQFWCTCWYFTCMATTAFAQNFTQESVYYFQHEYSGKYICTGSQDNGANFHSWGPIPTGIGHEPRYRFKILPSGKPEYYYLLHEYSAKYLCSGGQENGSNFHTWGPIPSGHENRYRFKIIPTEKPEYFYLMHEYSGRYICTGGLENGSNLHSWGPIPPGHESRYRFKITKSPDYSAQLPTINTTPIVGNHSREVAPGRFVRVNSTLFRDGTLSLKVSTQTKMAFYGMKGTVMILCIDNQGRFIYMSEVFTCETLCSTSDPKCKSTRNDEPFLQKLPQSVGENTSRFEFHVGDKMNFHNVRQTVKNTMNSYIEGKQIVGPLAKDLAQLLATL